jgi:anti-anti-sigma factor
VIDRIARGFDAELVHVDGQARIALRGDLDVLAGSALGGAVDRALEVALDIVLDLAEVRLLDGAGVGALVLAAERARAGFGTASTRGVPPTVARTLLAAEIDPASLDARRPGWESAVPWEHHPKSEGPRASRPENDPVSLGDENFSVDLEVLDGVTRLTLRGEFDMAGVPIFDAAVEHLRSGLDVRVDAGALAFVDSSGLLRLVQLQERVAAHGHVVVLERSRAQALRVLELSGTSQLFVLDPAP